MSFKVFTDTSSGMPKALREKFQIEYFRMGLLVDDKPYDADLDYQEFSREQMYKWVKDPNIVIRTSLVSREEFLTKSEKCLKEGFDLLYVACTDALSGTRGFFESLKEELLEKYPERKIISINSCRAEMALGMMAIEAAKKRDEGASIEETYEYIEKNKQYFHQIGSIDTLKYLKMYGRVSGVAAFFADTFNIKPLIMADIYGNNYTFKKVHGPKKALEGCLEYIKDNMVEGVTDVVYIGQTMTSDAVAYLKKHVEEDLKLKTEEYYISPIVGICCGPGLYGCWFKGKQVTADSKKKQPIQRLFFINDSGLLINGAKHVSCFGMECLTFS